MRVRFASVPPTSRRWPDTRAHCRRRDTRAHRPEGGHRFGRPGTPVRIWLSPQMEGTREWSLTRSEPAGCREAGRSIRLPSASVSGTHQRPGTRASSGSLPEGRVRSSRHAPTDQLGVVASLSRRRARVQIPLGAPWRGRPATVPGARPLSAWAYKVLGVRVSSSPPCGSSSAGRASACQVEGRGSDPRLPL